MNTNVFSNKQVKVVSTFEDLSQGCFEDRVNALCWQRNLSGNFEEIVSKLSLKEDVTEVFSEDLLKLKLSESGKLARTTILKDLQLLTDHGASPSLNLIKNYQRDDELSFISTDVYSFHVDRSSVRTDTYLCTYYGSSSHIIPNDQAMQKIQIPEIRQHLLDIYEGDEKDFELFLAENFFDLHYQAKPDALLTNLGIGSLWKLAVDYPGQTVLPCIHRAPLEREGEYRLLLIC